MKYRYRYIDEMVDMIEGSVDPAVKMAVIWANRDDANLKSLVKLLYDFRSNFEVAGMVPYKRNRRAGVDLHTAVDMLETRLNQRVIGANQKFNFLVDILQQLQDRDAEVLERALKGQIKFGIPLEDIQRAYPEIRGVPLTAENAPVASVLSELKFPGTIVRQLQGPEVRVVCNGTGNFKFVGTDGRGLILPDKPKSVFNKILSPFKNVVLIANFVGLTKDQSKVGNTATTNAAYTKFQAGELEAETLGIRILDVTTIDCYNSYPNVPKASAQYRGKAIQDLSFVRRRTYLESVDLGDNIFARLADVTRVESLEALRAMEDEVTLSKDILRFYSDQATFSNGFHVLDPKVF